MEDTKMDPQASLAMMKIVFYGMVMRKTLNYDIRKTNYELKEGGPHYKFLPHLSKQSIIITL